MDVYLPECRGYSSDSCKTKKTFLLMCLLDAGREREGLMWGRVTAEGRMEEEVQDSLG